MATLEEEFEELVKKGQNPLEISLTELISKLAIIFEKLNLIKGDQGIQGEKGDKGDKGDTGPRGIQGPMGPMGLAGKDGRDGESIIGPVGKDGTNGLNGKDAQITDELKNELVKMVLEKIPKPQGQRFLGGRSQPRIYTEVITGTTSGNNVLLQLSPGTMSILGVWEDGVLLTPTTSWTVAGNTVTVLNSLASNTFMVQFLK